MANFSTLSSYLPLILTLLTLSPHPISSVNLDSEITLFGDAKLINNGSSIQVTPPLPSSSGLVIQIKPFKFSNSISFSTHFTFSISPHNGHGISLIIIPTDFPSNLSQITKFLGIEYDTSLDQNVGDQNANHVGVDVSSFVSAKVSNVSEVNLVLNSGVKLESWVDYEASAKRIEVRLSRFGEARPYDALLTYAIDLVEMWRGEDVFVGLSSDNGDSVQSCSVYEWSFWVRSVPKWMHSQPVNPEVIEKKLANKKSFCPFGVFSGLVFGIECGALTALGLLFLWAVFIKRKGVIPAADSVPPVDFRYEKISLVVENSFQDVKK